jgi:WD40-like Beta Propeller Repeat
MTDDRSLERAARSWIEVGPTQAPDRAVEAALSRIQTTPQERVLRIPWRLPLMITPARAAAAAVIGALAIGGAFLMLRPGQPAVGPPGPSPTASATPTPAPTGSASASAAIRVDYSDLPGRILVEHLGNALDGSEASNTDVHPERRRLYLMQPSDMTASSAQLLLPDHLPTSKISADVSPDGRRVVFQDTADQGRIWEANLDGTGFHALATTCTCIEGDPAYDPTGTKIVFGHLEGAQSWLGIRDLATGKVTRLDGTVGPFADAVPEQPSWSPDGTKIVFSRITWEGKDSPVSGQLSIVDVATGTVTDVPLDFKALAIIPGEPDWSPDGTTIVFTDGPLSSTAGVPDLLHNVYRVNPDGTGLQQLTHDGGAGAASWTPDGKHILFFDNYYWLMNPDGSGVLPVDSPGMDLSENRTGYAYIGHWLDQP